MNLSLSEDRTMLKDALTRALAKESTPARIRAAEKAGHDPALWTVFSEMGLPLLRVAEDHGGIGLGLLDAVLVAETVGEHLAVIPAVDVMVTARLLSDLGSDAALALLGQVAEGAVVGLALHDAAQTPEQLVATAASAQVLVFRQGDEIRALAGPLGEVEANLGAFAARKVTLAGGDLLAAGPEAVRAFEAAIEEWKLLNAASIAAAARQAILNAAEYAKERQAFGRPIGSYQGLAHPLAEAFAEVDGAALLVWRTVEAIGAGRPDAAALVSMAAWWAAKACQPAVIKAMRVFGGYGMTMEYDAQIFFRRVTALSLLMGDPNLELQKAADRLWGGASVALPDAGEVGISF
ncbi:MAG: hypothetical protein JWO33_381, partial [Caulobacteraceae bacterium]|nr:hypothetical protein [Caulobacteraceae bacterium]